METIEYYIPDEHGNLIQCNEEVYNNYTPQVKIIEDEN